jgi:hypothetical protein
MARGDRLEVRRRLLGSLLSYRHHGIDIGDGTVVHARPHDFRRPFGGGIVVRTPLQEFADGEAVRTVNEPPAAFAPHDVAARALAHVGRDGYCPMVANCEHFTTWCATGRASSRHVEAVVRGATAMAATTVAVAVAWFGGPAGRAAARTMVARQLRP